LRVDAAAVGGEAIPSQRGRGCTSGTIIDDIGPEPHLDGFALAGHQHRHGRVIDVDLAGLDPFFPDTTDDRVKQMCGLCCPACQRRSVDIEALCRHHLGLAIEGEMMIELGDDDMGERGEASLASGNRLYGRRGLARSVRRIGSYI